MPPDPHRESARLRGLLEVTRLIRSGERREAVLQAIARTVGETLGFGTVVINIYRPQWDDFRVEAIHGGERAVEALVGDVRGWDVWRPLLDPRFARGGAFFVPHGHFDWEALAPNAYIPDLPESEDPGAWHPEDLLAAPMRRSSGELLGVLAVDEPDDGRIPDEAQIDALAAVAAHAALALQSAEETARAHEHQVALEELMNISRKLTGTVQTQEILQAVCEGIHVTLGFRSVAVDLPDAAQGGFCARAAVGWDVDDPTINGVMTEQELLELMRDEFEIEGCYLLDREQATGVIDPRHWLYHSELNGRGPRGWDDHWLMSPLIARSGELAGIIWADDPEDRMVPDRERLQALRIFANQAAAALGTAHRFEEVRYLANHDALTKLRNRRAFGEQLAAEAARATRYRRPLSLVVCDLDGFKQLNDTRGHLAGDRVLETFAGLLLEGRRDADGVYRIGGDEFALILPETGADDAAGAIARIREAMPASAEGRLAQLTASFGAARHSGDAATGDDLFRSADRALYEDKRRHCS